MKNRYQFIFLSMITLAMIAGCAKWKNQQGVSNRWRDESLKAFTVGETSQSEVSDVLGPPSQVISMKDQTIFYYMLEEKKGKGLFLLLFNWTNATTIYDRAIFFFDEDKILSDYSYSFEKADFKDQQ